MPLTSSVVTQKVSNFRQFCCSQKIQMLRKNVKVSFGTASILHFCRNSVWGQVPFNQQNKGEKGSPDSLTIKITVEPLLTATSQQQPGQLRAKIHKDQFFLARLQNSNSLVFCIQLIPSKSANRLQFFSLKQFCLSRKKQNLQYYLWTQFSKSQLN